MHHSQYEIQCEVSHGVNLLEVPRPHGVHVIGSALFAIAIRCEVVGILPKKRGQLSQSSVMLCCQLVIDFLAHLSLLPHLAYQRTVLIRIEGVFVWVLNLNLVRPLAVRQAQDAHLSVSLVDVGLGHPQSGESSGRLILLEI